MNDIVGVEWIRGITLLLVVFFRHVFSDTLLVNMNIGIGGISASKSSEAASDAGSNGGRDSKLEEASDADSGSSPASQADEAGDDTSSSGGDSSSQPGEAGDGDSSGGSASQPGEAGDNGDLDLRCQGHGRPRVELLAIHADLHVKGTEIVVFDSRRGQIIYRKEEGEEETEQVYIYYVLLICQLMVYLDPLL